MEKGRADEEHAAILRADMTKMQSLQLQSLCESSPERCAYAVADLTASSIDRLARHIHCHHVLVKILGLRGPAARIAAQLLSTLEPSLSLQLTQHVYGCRVMIAALKHCDVCAWSRAVRDSVLEAASTRGCGG